MVWTLTRDLEEWQAEAGEFLRGRPVANTVLLTVSTMLRRRGPGYYGDGGPRAGWWRDGSGEVAGALLWTPPRPVHVSPVPPDAVEPLAGLLSRADEGRPVTRVDLEWAAVEPFRAAWRRHTGGGDTPGRRTRLYRLAELAPPDPVPPGRARPGTAADLGRLTDWVAEFSRGTDDHVAPPRDRVADWLDRDAVVLWERDGVPVSMAATTPRVAGQTRICAVYTPPEHRRRGYAAAVTAAASRRAGEAGADEVLLFTDVANPTSNGVYQRIGYRPVLDRLGLRLDAG
ncbi:GNAT family N-acetyltransferase [Streptomyces sp. B6B3]|uniref:GNAT family N-acetyltransferase n=1 Tax=Streptomyces sp. B6B3 TaxID=3153570 RepID=UPI00325CA4F5